MLHFRNSMTFLVNVPVLSENMYRTYITQIHIILITSDDKILDKNTVHGYSSHENKKMQPQIKIELTNVPKKSQNCPVYIQIHIKFSPHFQLNLYISQILLFVIYLRHSNHSKVYKSNGNTQHQL